MTKLLALRTTLSVLLLLLTAGFSATMNAEETPAGINELANLKTKNAELEKSLQACRLVIAKNDEEIKALREVNQVLANTLELTRQALNESEKKNPTAKPPF